MESYVWSQSVIFLVKSGGINVTYMGETNVRIRSSAAFGRK